MEELVSSWIIIVCAIIFIFIVGLFILIVILRIKRKRRYDLARITLKDIDQMTGHEFEEYLYVLFVALEYEETFLTKKSGDYGADLLFTDRDNNRTVVQAKRFTDKLGLAAVQEVHTAKAFYDAHRAIIITSTNNITEPCLKLASATEVAIIDRDDLGEIITAFKKNHYSYAKELIEEEYEQVQYNASASLEAIEQRRGIIQAGEYYYKK